LFAHVDPAPDLAQVATFAAIVPLPDMIMYVRRPRALLIERIRARGHHRISNIEPRTVVRFVEHAEQTFECLAGVPRLAARLVVADDLPIETPRRHVSGGVIAFVGPEATGKSTLVAATTEWLSQTAPACSIHAGKPPSTPVTAPVAQLLPLLRRRADSLRTTRLEHAAASRASDAPAAGWKSLVYAGRAVVLAWERRCLLLAASAAAKQGHYVVCDRYPSELPGAMDSPRLLSHTTPAGVIGYPYRWLASIEQSLYAQIPPPDVVVRLYVSLETAKQRNKHRDKDDKQGDAYIAARHAQCRQWRREGTHHVIDIDTEQPLDVTIDSVREAIAQALT
jgi:thymidylate kinase